MCTLVYMRARLHVSRALRRMHGQVLDEFGDHHLSCDQGIVRISHHHAGHLCDVIFDMLLLNNSDTQW